MKTKVSNFHIQPTKSFPDGAPQREEYDDDSAHLQACGWYGHEWRSQYECMKVGCKNPDCPQHFPMEY